MSIRSLGLATLRVVPGATWLAAKLIRARTGAAWPDSASDPAAGQPARASSCEHIDLCQALRTVSGTHGPMLRHLDIRLDLVLPDQPLIVAAHAAELQQLMAHIFDVAANALPEDATLQVLARSEGRHAVVNWRDSVDGPPRLSQAFDTAAGAAAVRVRTCQTIAARYGARLYTAPSPLGDGCLTLRFPQQGPREAPASAAHA